jgi:ATP-dependent Clp protease ATP-binding subunit ClpE
MKILDLLLDEIKETLLEQKITFKVYSDVKKILIAKGYDNEYGARSLRRTVETELLDKVAEFLLKNSQRPLKIKAKADKNNIEINL